MKKIEPKYNIPYYFKTAYHNAPRTFEAVTQHYKEHGCFPFLTPKDELDTLYEFGIESQRKGKVYNEQFFTPPQLATQFANCFESKIPINSDDIILDLCCGFGQLSMSMMLKGFKNIVGLEVDEGLCDAYSYFLDLEVNQMQMREYISDGFDFIISNPPYSNEGLIEFFLCLKQNLSDVGTCLAILPRDMLKTNKNAELKKCFELFAIDKIEDSKYEFFHTKCSTSIYHIQFK